MDREIDYKKLRNFRVDQDFKQKEIAAKLNITPSAYSRIERGERGLRVVQLKVIAEILGKNINEFFKEIKTMKANTTHEMKMEIKLLESILGMISAEVESELFSLYYIYDSKYPDYPLTYEEYLSDSYSNPEMAIWSIKNEIKQYNKTGENPSYYNLCEKKRN
jgi:transcriptional regulator with XRE-family HTH domain